LSESLEISSLSELTQQNQNNQTRPDQTKTMSSGPPDSGEPSSAAARGKQVARVQVNETPVDVDEVLKQTASLLPFTPNPALAFSYVSVPSESTLSADTIKDLWNRLFKRWEVSDNDMRTLLMNAVLLYLVENGSSPRGPYTGHLVVRGKRYSMAVFKDVVGERARKFARAHANYVRAMMASEDCRPFAITMASRFGMIQTDREFAFDFADACTGLDKDVMSRIMAVKRETLYGKVWENDPSAASSGVNARQTPHTQGSAGSHDTHRY
jgi:hypothetical protein